MNFLHQGFRKLSSDRQTDRQTDRHDRNYKPRRFAGGEKGRPTCTSHEPLYTIVPKKESLCVQEQLSNLNQFYRSLYHFEMTTAVICLTSLQTRIRTTGYQRAADNGVASSVSWTI